MWLPHRRQPIYRCAPCLVALTILGIISSTVSAQSEFPPLPDGQGLGPTDEEIFPVPGNPPQPLAFGESIASDGNDLLIGMPFYGHSVGRVAVFRKNASGLWKRVGTLDSPNPSAQANFGNAIDLKNDCAVISGDLQYQFRRQHGLWVQVQKAPLGQLTCEQHEVFVSAQDAVLVLHPDKTGRLDPSHPRQTLTNWEGISNIGFGASIAASDRTLLVGARDDADGAGAVFTFVRRGLWWVRGQKLIATDGQPGDHFGQKVAIIDGYAAIGAPDKPAPPDPTCFPDPHGVVYVFLSHQALWSERATLDTPHCAVGFGSNLAMNRTLLAVGDVSVKFSHAGSAYVYRPMNWTVSLFGVAEGPGAGAPVFELTPRTLFIGFPFDESPWPIGSVGAYRITPHEQQP